MIRCSRCLLPESYPGIEFDTDGVCNICREAPPYTPLGEEELRRRTEPFRNRGGKYDAVVMFSGGRDSTYVLYYAVTQLRLNVLAYTVDNGFLPDETHENIRTAVERLGVDHEMVRHNLLRDSLKAVLPAYLHNPSPAMIGLLCLGCRSAIKKAYIHGARMAGTPLVLLGDGEPETSFASAFFTKATHPLLRITGVMAGMGWELLKNPRYLLTPCIPWRMMAEAMQYFVLPHLRRVLTPDIRIFGVFHFLPWIEEEITRVISGELGWRQWSKTRAAWRSDCKIAMLKNYLYHRTLGFSKNDDVISGLIRRGIITSRDEALARLERENVFNDDALRDLIDDIGLPPALLPKLGIPTEHPL